MSAVFPAKSPLARLFPADECNPRCVRRGFCGRYRPACSACYASVGQPWPTKSGRWCRVRSYGQYIYVIRRSQCKVSNLATETPLVVRSTHAHHPSRRTRTVPSSQTPVGPGRRIQPGGSRTSRRENAVRVRRRATAEGMAEPSRIRSVGQRKHEFPV